MTECRSTGWATTIALGVLAAPAWMGSAGCGVNTALTDTQQEQDHRIRMAWIDKAVEIAERHGLAYRVELESTGRPSVGQSLDFYIDTGLSARMSMFGNGASRRPFEPEPPFAPAPSAPAIHPADAGDIVGDSPKSNASEATGASRP